MNNKQVYFYYMVVDCIAIVCMFTWWSTNVQPNHPDINILRKIQRNSKTKMIQESDNEFTKQLFDEFDIDAYDAWTPREKRVQLRLVRVKCRCWSCSYGTNWGSQYCS